MVTTLTNSQIKSLQPANKDRYISVGSCVYIKIHKTGAKTWNLRMKTAGKYAYISLGSFPEMNIKQALDKAAEYKESLKEATSTIEPTLNQLANKWFNHVVSNNTIRESTIKDLKWRLNSVLPVFGDRLISSISPSELSDFLNDTCLSQKKTTKARYVFDLIAKLEVYAVSLGYIDSPRFRAIKEQLLPKREVIHNRTISADSEAELEQRLKELSDTLKASDLSQHDMANFFILLLSLLRTNELCNLKAEYVDQDSGLIVLPDSVMKAKRKHRVPMSRQLAKLVNERVDTGAAYVCPKLNKSARPLYKNYYLNLFNKAGISGIIVPHGVRALARTWFAQKDFNFYACEMCLAHTVENATQQSYQHSDYLAQRLPIMQAWGDFVERCFKDNFPEFF